jgi:hypothetical protein
MFGRHVEQGLTQIVAQTERVWCELRRWQLSQMPA